MTGRPAPTKLLLLTTLLTAATMAAAADPYLLFERLLNRDKLPRLLSTVDFGLDAVEPETLEPIQADVTGDGKTDMVASGAYNLPGKGPAYFLLVAGDVNGKPAKLFLKEGPAPFYLHKAGSTGDADPGTEAFSATTCLHCSTGTDFHWDPRNRTFTETAWKPIDRRMTVSTTTPGVDVDPRIADEALRVAGQLKDVQDFVAEVNKRGTQLVTRVAPGEKEGLAVVSIYERVRGLEDERYDAITVDVQAKRVVSREKVRHSRGSGNPVRKKN